MITLVKEVSALLLAAGITSFAGPPSTQVVDFDTLPPKQEWAALAKEAACNDVEAAAAPITTPVGDRMFKFSLPVDVTLRVWEQRATGDAFTPREFYRTVVKGCTEI
jgi:hypothetical protein